MNSPTRSYTSFVTVSIARVKRTSGLGVKSRSRFVICSMLRWRIARSSARWPQPVSEWSRDRGRRHHYVHPDDRRLRRSLLLRGCGEVVARRWDEASVIAAIRQHAELYGDPPVSTEWATARRPTFAPTAATVRQVFGSWNAAMQAAGYSPRPRGAPGHLIPLDRDWRGHFLPR